MSTKSGVTTDRSSSPPSVVHIVAPARVGGLETVVTTLAGEQCRRGLVRVIAILSEKDDRHPFVVALQDANVACDVIVSPGRQYVWERAEISRMLRSHASKIVHTHGYRPDVLHGGVARKLGIGTVSSVHGFTGGDLRNRFYEWLQVRAYSRFDAVVAVSKPLASLLRGRGVPEKRLHVLPNAYQSRVDLVARDQARVTLGIPSSAKAIGWVGRLSKEKAADIAVHALALVALDPNARLVVIGEGPEGSSLRELASSLNVSEKVIWAGPIPNASALYRAFDLFVLSSRTEGTPMVLLEAMAAGIPSVATAVGGVPDVLDATTGWLAQPESPESLANAVSQALSNPSDAAARAQAASHRLASQFAIGPWVEKYDSIYRSVLA